jgi:sterol desaturase/sphingolipid hydroxylase (fatty acid hydroxylase superfamily)
MTGGGIGIWAIMIPAALFVILAALELVTPRRTLALGRMPRWITHGVFSLCNMALGRALLSLLSVASAAEWARNSGLGLFNLTSWPVWLEAALAIITLDFAVWLQHVMMHRIPLLWRMHKVHHSDRDLDVSSALRFHPFEIAASLVYKSACVAMLGVPPVVAVAFEVWLSANALFNHSNIDLPRRVDWALRVVLVTPDYHFVHHSIDEREQQGNYGFALTWWDRLARVYRNESAVGRERQTVGLTEAQDERPGKAIWSLLLPLR